MIFGPKSHFMAWLMCDSKTKFLTVYLMIIPPKMKILNILNSVIPMSQFISLLALAISPLMVTRNELIELKIL